MNSIQFVESKISEIFTSIEGVSFRYEHQENLMLHIIEVTPSSIFRNNRIYINLEIRLEEEFVKCFPREELIFISEESLTKVTSPRFQLMSREVDVLKYKMSLLIPSYQPFCEGSEYDGGTTSYALAA